MSRELKIQKEHKMLFKNTFRDILGADCMNNVANMVEIIQLRDELISRVSQLPINPYNIVKQTQFFDPSGKTYSDYCDFLMKNIFTSRYKFRLVTHDIDESDQLSSDDDFDPDIDPVIQ